MLGAIQLLRPKNCLMSTFSVIIVALVAAELDIMSLPVYQVLAASLVVLAFTGAGNALNDVLDREIDRHNHPERPLPSGKVGLRTAKALSALLFAAAVALGLWLSIYCMLIILINLAIMLSYEFKAKSMGLAGNIMISWLTASLFLFGGFAVLEQFPGVMEAVLFMFLLSFTATIGREIAKDIQDMGGDEGRVTLPMIIGVRKSSILAAGAFFIGIGISPMPFIFGVFGFLYLVGVLLADAIFIHAALQVRRQPAKASESAKMAMIVSLFAFLLGVI